MTEIAAKVKGHVDEVFEIAGIDQTIAVPRVFQDRDQQAAPSQLQEWAQYVASNREYVSEHLQAAQHTLALVDAMLEAAEGDAEDRLQERLSENAPILINRGFAAQERMAHAKVSLVERSVDLRAARVQRNRLSALVGQLKMAHGEWRAAEFTLDRMVRLTTLRLQLSEV